MNKQLKKKFISIISSVMLLGVAVLITTVSNLFNHITSSTPTKPTTVQVKTINDLPLWSYEQYPEYYLVAGPAVIDTATFPNKGEITYLDKDHLGRTQAVHGVITLDMIHKSSAEERPDFKRGDNPSGWSKNVEVDIVTFTGNYHGWFWNRSHLIADRLGGEATSFNAITGTRMQNVGSSSQTGGMYYIEEKTVDYLRTHRSDHVYYSATPVYLGDELIPRYVIVDALSGSSELNERVITFNTQHGYSIDYNTGQFTKN